MDDTSMFEGLRRLAAPRSNGHAGQEVYASSRQAASLSIESGHLELIPISQLEVDSNYQRGELPDHVKAIAKGWNLKAAGCIVVGRRPDGSLNIIDGQQRTAAAKARGDIAAVPCVVYDVEDSHEEAILFRLYNGGRRTVTAIQRHQADVHGGEPVAAEIQRLCDAHGLVVRNNTAAGSIKCAGALRECITDNPKAFRRVWPLIVEVSNGDVVRSRVVRSLFWLEKRMDKEGLSLTDLPWRDRVLRIDSRQIEKAASSLCAHYGRGNARIWAEAVAGLIDKGAHKRGRLTQFFRRED